MRETFPLFCSHLEIAAQYWKKILQPGDWIIDATCGNGKDTLRVAQMSDLYGGIIALDIQKEAIEATRHLLQTTLPIEKRSRIHLFQLSHEYFPELSKNQPLRLVIYNLGYLPGGTKSLTTKAETTLKSVKLYLNFLSYGGLLSITCYPGHQEGAIEQAELLSFTSSLDPKQWSVCHHLWTNRNKSPSLLIIQKYLPNC